MTTLAFFPCIQIIYGLLGVLAVLSCVRLLFPGLKESSPTIDAMRFHRLWPTNPEEKSPRTYQKAQEISQDLMEEFLNEEGIGVLFFGVDTHLKGVNSHARLLLGLCHRDDIGKTAKDILPQELSDALLNCWQEELNVHVPLLELPSIGSLTRDVSAQVILLRDKMEEAYGIAVFLLPQMNMPNGESASQESRYRQLALLGTHAASMVHEIKNPLVALKTFAELLPAKYNDPEFRDDFSKIALNQIRRIDTIVNDLLDYAKPKKPILVAGNPIKALEEAMDVLAVQMRENKIRVRRVAFKGVPQVRLDGEQLRRVFINVLLNAVEAMPKGGNLAITSRYKAQTGKTGVPGERVRGFGNDLAARNQADDDGHNGVIEICVADTGPGISMEDLNHIFEPFYSTKKKGSGLGLTISKRILEDHGGQIVFRSGKSGTVCVITLPAWQKPAAKDENGAERSRKTARRGEKELV